MSKGTFPGWRMTVEQHGLYWRMWRDVVKANGWDNLKTAEVNEKRALLHARAFNGPKSAKDIDPHKEFDAIKAEFLAWSNPASLNAQVKQERMPRTRLEHRIKIEQMRLLTILLGTGEAAASAAKVEPDCEAAWNYYSPVAAIHGGPDLAFVSSEPDPTRTDEKSDLELIRDTLDARLVKLRQERLAKAAGLTLREFRGLDQGRQKNLANDFGWTWHDVKIAAGVECDCALCRKAKPSPTAAAPREREEVGV